MKDTSNVLIITKEDTLITLQQWHERYGLKASETQLGKYFFLEEYPFTENLKDYGKLYVSELLIRVLDKFRQNCGRELHINSFNRSQAKQDSLTADGFRTAKVSPHVHFLAADIDTKSDEETRAFVPVLLKTAKDLGIVIRVGYLDYMKAGQTFIHCDVCPEYYAKGKTRFNQPHPPQWEKAYSIW